MRISITKKISLISLIITAVCSLGMILHHPRAAFSIQEIYIEIDSLSLGAEVFKKLCALCHRMNGEGMTKVIPPLAKSDYLKRDKNEIIELIISGKSDSITVNKINYNRTIPPSRLGDQEIADVLNYIYVRWDNPGTKFKEEEVKKVRLQLTGDAKK